MDYQGWPANITAFALGAGLHQLLFKRGEAFRRAEWDLWGPSIVGTIVAAQTSLAIYLFLFRAAGTYSLIQSIRTAWWLGTSLITGIIVSTLVYRAFYHRLNHFPGSFWARLSNFYPTFLAAKKLHLYEEVEKLHQQYGDFVRLGPQELSINNPKAVAALYSSQSQCAKGPWYNATQPRTSLQQTRDKAEHTRRRKTWDRAFGSKALRDYEPRVKAHTDQLLSQIDANLGKTMNVSDWFNFYSFDVMGDLAFGESFGMLKSGVKSYFMEATHEDMLALGYIGHLMWLAPFVKMTPGVNAPNIKFFNWLRKQVDKRIANPPALPDVFSWILDDYNAGSKTHQARLDLEEEAHLIVVAGSDTTAASLSCLFFHLAQSPSVLSKLREEIDAYFAENDNKVDSVSLSKLKYLDACISESLRLHPPVPSGVQRVTPPSGLTIDNTFIPGDTIVQVPMHTLFRDPRNFTKPNDFIPERWTDQTELTKDPGNSIPFSVGPYSCVGKQLALMEMRYVVSQIVRKYDFEMAVKGENERKVEVEKFFEAKTDAFTLVLGKLDLVFEKRK